VADTCIHGFAPGTCLICQTLEGGGGKRARRSATEARPGTPATVPGPAPAAVRPDAVVGPRRSSSLGLRVTGFLLLAIVALIVVSLVAGFVFAVLRILELVAVAVVAGWLGWKLGVHHGRHTRN
jgi:Flp pilus assembly protein TadB